MAVDWPRLAREARRRFGITRFLPRQHRLIEAVPAGRDMPGLTPTGAGKDSKKVYHALARLPAAGGKGAWLRELCAATGAGRYACADFPRAGIKRVLVSYLDTNPRR